MAPLGESSDAGQLQSSTQNGPLHFAVGALLYGVSKGKGGGFDGPGRLSITSERLIDGKVSAQLNRSKSPVSGTDKVLKTPAMSPPWVAFDELSSNYYRR